MLTFKEFINEALGGAFGIDNPDRGPRHDLGYLSTSNIGGYRQALMSKDRRQLLDLKVPGQKYQYIITLMTNLNVALDTGKLIGGDRSDPYKIVYSQKELIRYYPPEEQKMLGDKPAEEGEEVENYLKNWKLNVFQWTRGYDINDVIKAIGDFDIDEISKFQKGTSGINYHNLEQSEGFFIDRPRAEELLQELEKWINMQSSLQRARQVFDQGVMNPALQGMQMNRLKDPSQDIFAR